MSQHTLESIAETMEAQIRRMGNISADDDEFNRDTHIFDYGYVDSFGAAELVTFTEQTFGISISDEDLAHRPLNTVNEMATYVLEKVS